MLNAKVALRYAIGGAAVTALAFVLQGWGWLLLWLALSLEVQALAYVGAGAMVFQKKGGRLPWVVRILLAPYMICARITLHYYCRGLAPYAPVTSNVWIGRRLNDEQAREVVQKGVRAALDLTAGFPECEPLIGVIYRNIQLLPITVPTLDQLNDAVRFIQEESARGIVYVHGALGYSRSVGVVSAYLLAAGLAKDVPAAIEKVRSVTPQLDDVWMKRLAEFQAGLSRGAATRG